MKKYFTFSIVLLFFSMIFISCQKEDLLTSTTPSNVDANNNGFASKQVAQLFANSCAVAGCHKGSSPSSGLSIENFTKLLKGSTNRDGDTTNHYGGEVVIPFNSEKSLLYQILKNNVTPSAPHDTIALKSTDVNAVKNWIDNGAKDNNGNIPFSNPSFRVFVCDQASDMVSVIDGDAMVVSRIINVDQNAGLIDSPHMVKSRNGFLYVTLIADGKFLKFKTADLSQAGEVSGIEKAGMILLSPDGSKAYVSRSSTSSPIYTSVFAVNILDMTVKKEISLPDVGVPHGIALTPDGKRLYIANLTQHRISVVNGITDEYDHDIVLPVDYEPMQANISPDGKYLYISERKYGRFLVIDTQTDSMLTEVQLNPMPMQIAVTKDGNKIYVASKGANVVEIIQKSGVSWGKTGEISHPHFRHLHGIDLTADDKYLFVSSENHDPSDAFVPPIKINGEGNTATLGIIDTQTNKVIKVLDIEEYGSGLTVGYD